MLIIHIISLHLFLKPWVSNWPSDLFFLLNPRANVDGVSLNAAFNSNSSSYHALSSLLLVSSLSPYVIWSYMFFITVQEFALRNSTYNCRAGIISFRSSRAFRHLNTGTSIWCMNSRTRSFLDNTLIKPTVSILSNQSGGLLGWIIDKAGLAFRRVLQARERRTWSVETNIVYICARSDKNVGGV